MKNIFHHSAAYIMKHKYHHHLLIGLIVVAVAGTGGVVLYKKFASAATFTFTQSSTTGGWATQSSDTATHAAGNSANWSKYSEATGVTPSASGVSLSSTSKTSVDDGVGLSAKTDYTVGAAPGGVAVSADGTSVYVTNTNSSTISKFTRDPSTGALSAKTDYAAGANPGAITISADGASVYVTDVYAATVSMFTRNTSTGALSIKTDYTAGSNSPGGITISADGASVYVANGGPGTVSMFTRNTSTGALSAKIDYVAGTTPRAVTVSADGTSVYVVNTNSYNISKFTRDPSTGALSAKTNYATGANPYDITISPDGASVYVANYGSNTISKFTRNPSTGALSAKTDYVTGGYPYAVTISADGTSVYVTNGGPNTVSGFARNPSTGALSAKTDYATGANPYSITISADGASVYIANNSSASVSMYSRAVRGGALGFETGTLTSTTVTGSGAGASVGLKFDSGDGTSGAANMTMSSCSGTGISGSGGVCTLQGGTYNYTTFNIGSGVVVNVPTMGSQLIIKATGNVTIEGTLNVNGGDGGVYSGGSGGAGGASGGSYGCYEWGCGGGGGGGVFPGGNGSYNNFGGGGGGSIGAGASGNGNGSGGSGGAGGGGCGSRDGAGGANGGAGGGGSMWCAGATGGIYTTELGGSGGGGGWVGVGAVSGAGGGGGYLKIISGGNISNTGTVNANGGNGAGSSGGGTGTGSGGGSGGTIRAIASGNISNTGTVNANGGNGGTYSGGGGGGRIKLAAPSVTSGTLSVVGGTGYDSGSNGPTPEVSTNTSAYVSSGTFESATIDLGGKANLSTLDFTPTIPAQSQTSCTASTGAGCALKFQIAVNNDNSTWTYLGPDGTANTYFTSTGEAINSSLNGNRYIRYKAYLATADTAYTPTLDSLTLNYTQRALSGTLVSSKYDTGSDERVIGNIAWSPADSNLKFQVRSAASLAGLDTATWCGATDCTGSYFTVNTGVSGGLSAGHPLLTGGNDRYFQYRALQSGDGVTTPTLTSVTVSYVGNEPPAVSNIVTAGQISDPTDVNNYGKVSFSFDASDHDTEGGSENTKNKVTPTLYEYSADGTTNWTTICSSSSCSAGSLSSNAFSSIALATNSAVVTTTVVWTPPSGIARTTNAKIRITITDGEGASNSGTATMATGFTLDTTAPTIVTARMDSSGVPDSVTLTATDSSTLEYRLCNTACSNETWVAITSGTPTSIEWTAVGAPTAIDAETVYLQVRDLYGNVTANTITAPATPSGFLNADVSNPSANTFGESLSWIATPGFTTGWKYEVWSATTDTATTPPSSYSHLATTTTNVYAHTITTATTSARWYKIRTINVNGDISNFSTLMTEGDVPDSFGTTLPDEDAPVIEFLTAANIKNTSAEITFTTNELAVMQVLYGTADCSTGAGTATPLTTSYTPAHSVYLTDLSPNTTYYYCARVTDVLGNVGAITPGSTPTFTTVGGPVITNVTERELTDVSALIFWNTSTSSDSKVYYATAKASVNASTPVTGAAVTVAGTDGAYQHQVGLTGLASGSKYYYKVVSADALDAGIISTDDNNGQYYSFVTLRDTTPPTIMGTSTPVLASDAAVIVWQTDEMATTKVDYGTTPGVYTAKGVVEDTNFSIYHVVTLSSATANVHGASGDKNALTPETTYYYRVTSKDAANNSATSEGTFTTPKTGDVTIVAVTVAAPVNPNTSTVTPDTTAPTISNVKVDSIMPFSAVVKFDTSEDANAGVEYGKDTAYGDIAGEKTLTSTHTLKLRGLTLGTEYHIKVTARDKSGNTGTSDDQTFKTPFLSENLKDMTKIENIEQFQKEIEETIESILPSLVPPFVSKPSVTDITENGATVSFRTNIRAFPVVGFVEDGTYDTTKDNPYSGEISDMAEKASDHTIALTGLKQNTKYHLQARAFSLPKVIGKSADITFTTKASKISGSIVERKKDSFTVVWTTDESTTSIVEYKNLKTRITERKTDDVKRTAHSMKIDNLPPGTTYEVDISGINEQGNVVEAGATLTVTTSRDVTEPIISGFKVDNALVPGRTDRIQTIVSWKTDEAANSTVYYEEGAGTAGDTRELANKNEVLESYITAHSVILPNLKPGTIYRLKVTSSDDSGNEASFGPRTVITPRQTESITDIIFKNFEDSFKFLRKI